MSGLKVIEGDLIALAQAGAFDVIVHGCNCFCSMGAGIARGIRTTFPEAYAADQATESGSKEKLGQCSLATVERNGHTFTVVNAYTQYPFSGEGVLVDYEAVRSCMRWINTHFPTQHIGLPQIGAGLAGGDWQLIEAIIEEELADGQVTLVMYKP